MELRDVMRPVCWRCEEEIVTYYSTVGVVRWEPSHASNLPETFLCSECTDEMAEMNR